MEKAKRSIRAAKGLIEDEDYDFASSRIYYAIFYAMEAVLLTRNISSSKHTGVISQFNQFYIKEGIFPKSFSKIISRLFRERQEGDYGFYVDISEEDILIDVKSAEFFLERINKYLKEEDYL
ncbi:MAG TPA: HEPN domain-containing protein [Candidatus Kapabacteria bacterium]|nr:HEPN domain-containing protein [Candidatus Kapabacteria bacterium]